MDRLSLLQKLYLIIHELDNLAAKELADEGLRALNEPESLKQSIQSGILGGYEKYIISEDSEKE